MNASRIVATIALGIALTIAGWKLAPAATDLEAPYNTGQPVDVISNTPAVQAAAYAAGDVFGGKQVITVLKAGNRSALVRSILIDCKVAIATGFDVILFSSDPSGSTFTENGPIAVAAGDVAKVVAVATVTTLVTYGTPSSAILQGQAIPIIGDGTNRTIWAVLVAKGATTPTGTADCTLRLGLELN